MTSFDNFNKNFRKNLRQAIDQALDRTTLNETGEFLANQIKVRTRSGRGVAESGARPQSLLPLTPGYIEARTRFTGLSSDTTPRKSNLTQTGQMLDSISYDMRQQDQTDRILILQCGLRIQSILCHT